MSGVTTIVVGLCLVAIAAWAVLLWSRQHALRVFLGVSVTLHGALFLIPSTAGRSTPNDEDRLLIIPYTIIQGSDNPAADATAEVASPEEEWLDDPAAALEQPRADVLDADAIPLDAAHPEPAPAGAVDPTLPEIKNVEWFDFDAHPGAASYRKELQRVIQRHFEVPRELDERGYEGRIKVWLNLGRDGRLNYCFLDPIMRSQEPEINRLTEENLKKIVGEFPPFPEGVKDYDVSFYVIIDYRNLRNR